MAFCAFPSPIGDKYFMAASIRSRAALAAVLSSFPLTVSPDAGEGDHK